MKAICCSSKWFLSSWQAVFAVMLHPPSAHQHKKVRCPLNVMSPVRGGAPATQGRWPFWKGWRRRCYISVVSCGRHHPSSYSHSAVGVLAKSLGCTFQNNSVSSHFHCSDSPCCLWRWGQAPVSFMRVSPSSHINLVRFNAITPEVFLKRLLPLFS